MNKESAKLLVRRFTDAVAAVKADLTDHLVLLQTSRDKCSSPASSGDKSTSSVNEASLQDIFEEEETRPATSKASKDFPPLAQPVAAFLSQRSAASLDGARDAEVWGSLWAHVAEARSAWGQLSRLRLDAALAPRLRKALAATLSQTTPLGVMAGSSAQALRELVGLAASLAPPEQRLELDHHGVLCFVRGELWREAVALAQAAGLSILAPELAEATGEPGSDSERLSELLLLWLRLRVNKAAGEPELRRLLLLEAKVVGLKKGYASYRLQALVKEALVEAHGRVAEAGWLRVLRQLGRDVEGFPCLGEGLWADPVCYLEEATKRWRTIIWSHFPASPDAPDLPSVSSPVVRLAPDRLLRTEAVDWKTLDLLSFVRCGVAAGDFGAACGLAREAEAYLMEAAAVARELAYPRLLHATLSSWQRLRTELEDGPSVTALRALRPSLGEGVEPLRPSRYPWEVLNDVMKEKMTWDSVESELAARPHSLYLQWRQHMCESAAELLLREAKMAPEEVAWRSAHVLLEASGVALRQRARLGTVRARIDHSPVLPCRLLSVPDWKALRDSFAELVPSDWRAVLLHLSRSHLKQSKRRLWIVRLSPCAPPVVVPITLSADEVTEVERELARIDDENNRSIKLKLDKATFWRMRTEANGALHSLCQRLEQRWLGPWKFLLRPSRGEDGPEEEELTDLRGLGWTSEGAGLIAELLEDRDSRAKGVLDFISALAQLCPGRFWTAPEPKGRATRTTRSRGKTSSTSSTSDGELGKQTLGKLKAMWLAFSFAGLGVGSSEKQELCRPVALLLSSQLHGVPWESLAEVRGLGHLSRSLSVHLLLGQLGERREDGLVRPAKSYYVVNPLVDLSSTEALFEPLFSRNGWSGVAGARPGREAVRRALETPGGLYVYCGHGSGTELVGGGTWIRGTRARAAALLIGCASVRLKGSAGPFEPRGTLEDYALSGCPAVLGCLWAVTDKDIDGLFLAFLRAWLQPPLDFRASPAKERLEPKGRSPRITQALALARPLTKLPFLTGAAPVLYGLPITSPLA